MKILAIHGPNLDLLGKRETDIYGEETLERINAGMKAVAVELGAELEFCQSNHEGDIVDKIGNTDADGIIINPAAYTHTSVAIRDALIAKEVLSIEIHLSNIHAREAFRKESFFSDIAVGVISGLGPVGYELALTAAIRYLEKG